MRSALYASVLATLLVACAGSTGENADSSSGAASAGVTLQTGHYENFDLVVTGSNVSGSYYSQVGDPAHGGATCSFTFSGTVKTVNGVQQGTITAVDGWDATPGTIKAITDARKTAGVALHLDQTLNACDRSSPSLTSPDGDQNLGKEALAKDITAFRSAARKTFFYDAAGGAHRSSYVLQGDILQVTGPEKNGFVPVRYVAKKTTSGYVQVADLMAEQAPASQGGLALSGSFELQDGNGISSGFEVTEVKGDDVTFNLTAVRTNEGGNFGDIQGGHAKLAGSVATYDEGASGCKISFTFDASGAAADVQQTGACSDFGAFVDASGHYTKK